MENQASNLISAANLNGPTASLIKCTSRREVFDLVVAERNLTIDKAIDSVKIVQLSRRVGEAAVMKAITGALIMASEYFSVSRPFTESQAVQTASLLIESYGCESLEDIILCLKYAKSGHYGKTYNRFDGELIFEWFRKYLDQKYDRFEQIKQNEKHQHINQQSETFGQLTAVISPILDRMAPAKQNLVPPVTDKTHFQNFLSLMPLCSPEELTTFRDHFTTENKKHFNSPFTPYINAINNHLSTHPP